MAHSKALTVITREAKRLKKQYPHRYDKLKKSERWSKGYIRQASAIYASKHHGKSPVGKKRKTKATTRRRKVSAARKPVKGKHLVKYVEKSSTERVMNGRRRKKSHRVYTAGSRPRRRSVSGLGGNMGLLLGLGAGALVFYLLTKKTTPTAPITQAQLPPIAQTSNYTRNTQSSDIVNYAIAAGIGLNAISSLIDKLNNSSDTDVSNIYDSINTTGDVGAWV